MRNEHCLFSVFLKTAVRATDLFDAFGSLDTTVDSLVDNISWCFCEWLLYDF